MHTHDSLKEGRNPDRIAVLPSWEETDFKLKSTPDATLYNCQPAKGRHYFAISKTMLTAHKPTGSASCPAT